MLPIGAFGATCGAFVRLLFFLMRKRCPVLIKSGDHAVPSTLRLPLFAAATGQACTAHFQGFTATLEHIYACCMFKSGAFVLFGETTDGKIKMSILFIYLFFNLVGLSDFPSVVLMVQALSHQLF